MHVSSTEPARLRSLGHSSTLPEKYGVDFLWWNDDPRGWCGVQRKEVKDFVASLHDGRLGRELHQMEPLTNALLVVEGKVDRFGDTVVAGRSRVPVMLWDAALWAVQDRGVKVGWTFNHDETEHMIVRFQRWTRRNTHTAVTRTRPRTWGKADDENFRVHLLTSLPGVGEQLARNILRAFGRVPWTWTVTEEELRSVPGIGRERARRMLDAFG